MTDRSLPTGWRICAVCNNGYVAKNGHTCKQGAIVEGPVTLDMTHHDGVPIVPVKRKTKDSPRKLNKTEQRFFEFAKATWGTQCAIIPQCLALPLDGGGTYHPDFLIVGQEGVPLLVETKGGYLGHGWEQGIERFRRARHQWERWFRFELWEWKDKKWSVEV